MSEEIEKRLKKLETWAGKVGPVITSYQKKVKRLETKVTEQRAEIRALERRLSDRPPTADDLLRNIYGGDRVKCQAKNCGKIYVPEKDFGHFCSNGAWIKHDEKMVKN